jgi:hypothetical protein
MNEISITRPELILVAGTRVALGVGIGLLLADRFSDSTRRAIGWTLTAFGALITVPIALEVLGKPEPIPRSMGVTAPNESRRRTLEGVPSGV